jgi:hypothetical protein
MSKQIIRRSGMAVDMQSALPWLMATGAYALLLALGPRLLSDPDTYSHIALGRWILDQPHRSDHRSILSKLSRSELGRVRVALANRICWSAQEVGLASSL